MAAVFSALFWLTAILNLTGELIHSVPLRYASKPFLMIFLGVWFFLKTNRLSSGIYKLAFVAFIFSWFGDLLLMKDQQPEIFFLLGLVAFLLAHIFYILTFNRESARFPGKGLLLAKPYTALPVIVVFATLIIFLFPRIEPFMRVPVIVYACVITLMALAALNRWKKVDETSFWLVMTGALLFMFSDSLIAINRFASPFGSASFFIMLLYITAQFLIAKGIAKNKIL